MSKINKHKKLNCNEYYMYGTHAIKTALKNKNRLIKEIYCTQKQTSQFEKNDKNIQIRIVDTNYLNKKVGNDANHQGVIALVETTFQNQLNNTNLTSEKDKVAILDQISDPHNIGAIIRSAAAFGISKIILPKDNCPEENAVIAKTACGCLEHVTIIKVTNIKNAIKTLKENNYWVAGLDGKGDTPLHKAKSFDKLAIIIGSEGKGMRKLTTECCDLLVKIPMSTEVESLNASVAASIVFYELNCL